MCERGAKIVFQQSTCTLMVYMHQVVSFRLYFFYLRQAAIEFLKTLRNFVSEPNNMMSFSMLVYQFIHI